MSSKVSTEVWKPDLFKGKVVFVTGGAGSICRVQTEALVILGADAAIVGRNPAKTDAAAVEIAKLRPGAKVILCSNTDVRDVKLIAKAVEKTVNELGRIDFVIAGAAGNFLSDFNHLSSNAFTTLSKPLLSSLERTKVRLSLSVLHCTTMVSHSKSMLVQPRLEWMLSPMHWLSNWDHWVFGVTVLLQEALMVPREC